MASSSGSGKCTTLAAGVFELTVVFTPLDVDFTGSGIAPPFKLADGADLTADLRESIGCAVAPPTTPFELDDVNALVPLGVLLTFSGGDVAEVLGGSFVFIPLAVLTFSVGGTADVLDGSLGFMPLEVLEGSCPVNDFVFIISEAVFASLALATEGGDLEAEAIMLNLFSKIGFLKGIYRNGKG